MLTVFRFVACVSLLLAAVPGQAAGVRVQFDPARPEIGPFPTDYLTAPATNTNTARRVRLPAPDCSAQPNACQDISLVNQLDGFSLQGRVRVRFSGAVNPDTLQSGIFLIARENYLSRESGVHKDGDRIGLNQFVWDANTNTAYAKPDGPTDQHRRYLLVVTDAVKDTSGDAVESDPAFVACNAESATEEYCRSLAAALRSVTGVTVVAASVFSTMSVTSWLEKARESLAGTPPAPQPLSSNSYLPTAELDSLVWRRQIRTAPSTFEEFEYPGLLFAILRNSIKGVAFGEFASPDYLGETRSIPASPSAGEPAAAPGAQQLPYIVFVPKADKPANGYPVVIFGHGAGDSRFGAPSLLSIPFADSGMASIAINAPGHGFGPASTLRVRKSDATVDVPAPGRGVDINGDGLIGDSEGCGAVVSSPLGLRDCFRQAAVDLLQLVRAIRSGMDVDGDGSIDLDPDRIYYAGQSLGGMYGTLFLAVEPAVQSAALNVAGGSIIDIGRWSPSNQRFTAANLALRRPALNTGEPFDDGFPVRNQPVRIISDATKIEVQNVLDIMQWMQAEGDPVGFSPHLKTSPLPGVPAKKVLFQYAVGDQTVPNPASTTLVRWSGFKENAWIYRHDVVRGRFGTAPVNPHPYLVDFQNLLAITIAQAAQGQIANFLATGSIPNPNGSLSILYGQDIFVQPEVLPEDFNYLEP